MSDRKSLDNLINQGDLNAPQSADAKSWEDAPACGREYGASDPEDFIEQAIEQAIAQSGRAAAARSKAALDALGIDPADRNCCSRPGRTWPSPAAQ